MKPYGSSRMKIFGQVDVNLENAVQLLRTNGVKVTVHDKEPVQMPLPLSLGRGKENDPNQAVVIDKGKNISRRALAQRVRRERERSQGLISTRKELPSLISIQTTVGDVVKGSQIISKQPSVVHEHGSSSINPLTPAPYDVLLADVTPVTLNTPLNRFGISKRLLCPQNLGLELLPLQLNTPAAKVNSLSLEQSHLGPMSTCSFPVLSTFAASNVIDVGLTNHASTTLPSECVQKKNISIRTLAQRMRRDRERFKVQTQETTNLSLVSSKENVVQPMTSSMNEIQGEPNVTAPTTQVERTLIADQGVSKRRKVMCDVELPFMPSSYITSQNKGVEERVQIEPSLPPSVAPRVDILFVDGQRNDDVAMHTPTPHGLPHLRLSPGCSLPVLSSSKLQNQATTNLSLVLSEGNVDQPITSSMEEIQGEPNVTTPATQDERELIVDQGVSKRRKVMCDAESPFMPSACITPQNECVDERVQIDPSLAPSVAPRVAM